MGVIGSALLLVSFGLIITSLFLGPLIMGDCRTERGHDLISLRLSLTLALCWIGALGAGLLAARTWKVHRVGGALLALAVVLVAVPYGYFTAFSVSFLPGCYL
jgi:hypothetical protein